MSEENCAIFIRHLPSEWMKEDLDSLFSQLVPATILNHDEKKKTAVVEFADEATARNMMNSLHQFEIGGRRLVVEFARKSELFRSCSVKDGKSKKEGEQEETETTMSSYLKRWQAFLQSLAHVSEKWDLRYSACPSLRYFYPPPSPSILKNILIAVGSYPRFYTQVLHLMNKMHLPCPFDVEFPVPDAIKDVFSKPKVEQEVESDESELVSSGDNASRPRAWDILSRRRKRPKGKVRLTAAKRMRPPVPSSSAPSIPVSEVFESPSTSTQRRIDIRIPSEPSVVVHEISLPSETGFGMIERVGSPEMKADQKNETLEEMQMGIISPQTLARGRLSQQEMSSLSVFKRYDAGEPSQRLYVKNVARGVTEEELRCVFGGFVKWEDEQERETFHVQLLTAGRMKGQAFVTLASEKAARCALEGVNGFLMKEKPLVVQFARVAKAKPDEKSLLS